ADPLLIEAGTDLRATVADVRRLVYDLRPPTLDQLGLLHAIREQAERYSTPLEAGPERGPRIDVQAPDGLPPLLAAVEVAAYRIDRGPTGGTRVEAKLPLNNPFGAPGRG